MENTIYFTEIERMQAEKLSGVDFIVNDGGKWDETTSRIHCCEAVYYDQNYIRRSLKKWACSVREAYDQAVAAWQEEKAAGRAL
jgi:hypothetical protein